MKRMADMDVTKGKPLTDLSAQAPTREDKLLGLSMDFVFAVEDRMEELGMSRRQLAERVGCNEEQVTHVLSGAGDITIGTIAAYAAALDLDIKVIPSEGATIVQHTEVDK